MVIIPAALENRIADYIWSYDHADPGQPHSYWHHFVQIMVLVGRELMRGMLNLRSMSLVYTTLLAFIPLLAVSMWVLRWLGVHEQLEPGLASLLAPLGEQSQTFSSRVVEFVENLKIGLLGLLGLGLLIYTAISLMRKIESAFNYTWRLRNRRSRVGRFSAYISLLAVGPALVFSALALTASLSNLSLLTTITQLPLFGDIFRIFGKFLPYFLVIGAFTLIYLTVPATRVNPGSAFYGGLIAGIIWQSTGLLFAAFVGGSTSYTAIYSGFAIVMLFMVWIYLSWLILLSGASIAYYHQHPDQLKWQHLHIRVNERMREQICLQLMLSIGRIQQQQLSEQSSVENLATIQRLPIYITRRLLSRLESDRLVCRRGKSSQTYLLARPIEEIRLIDIIRSARGDEDSGSESEIDCNAAVSRLLDEIEYSYQSVLGDLRLDDLVQQSVEEREDENSLV